VYGWDEQPLLSSNGNRDHGWTIGLEGGGECLLDFLFGFGLDTRDAKGFCSGHHIQAGKIQGGNVRRFLQNCKLFQEWAYSSVCWLHTLSIATQGKPVRELRPSTRRFSDDSSYTPGPGNIRELQNVIERSVIVCETENFSVDASWLSLPPVKKRAGSQLYLSRRWQLKRMKSSKQRCTNAKGGCSDRRAQPPSWGSLGPPWNRRFGRSKSTRIVSGLSRKLEGSRFPEFTLKWGKHISIREVEFLQERGKSRVVVQAVQ
jgi:hypothetical protein